MLCRSLIRLEGVIVVLQSKDCKDNVFFEPRRYYMLRHDQIDPDKTAQSIRAHDNYKVGNHIRLDQSSRAQCIESITSILWLSFA